MRRASHRHAVGAVLVAAASLALATGCDAARTREGGAPSCTACHGSGGNPAPPPSPRGETSTATPGVGAHPLHLRDTVLRSAVACSECHVVPDRVNAPGHLGAPRLVWGPLATARGAQPTWDAAALRCGGVYCHGATLSGGSDSSPIWTYATEPDLSAAPEQLCARCHGWPPPPPHPQTRACVGCHGRTVRPDGSIDVEGGLHVNGALDFGGSGGGLGCDACHGFPPATGAHLVHFGWTDGAALGRYGDTRSLADLVGAGLLPADFPAYAFGCGSCHPLDAARHMDGTVEVELAGAGAPAGSLRARSPASAAYSGGRCSAVYCHSSGQADDAASGTPVYATTPGWTSGEHLGCSSCHANPPRYASGGSGTITANSHLGLAFDGYVFGHFGGLPGIWHPGPVFGSKHGGGRWAALNDASPITCQTCHYATVDPARSGPSGFYYLDTTGDYALAGAAERYDCLACHSPGGPAPVGTGGVRPLRHVNGARDVVFDPREALPAVAWLPTAPFTPSRPVWVTNAAPGVDPLPAGAVLEPDPIPDPPAGEAWPYSAPTLSLRLGGATWVPATKTCSNVACHLAGTAVVWGGAPEDYRATCARCHAP